QHVKMVTGDSLECEFGGPPRPHRTRIVRKIGNFPDSIDVADPTRVKARPVCFPCDFLPGLYSGESLSDRVRGRFRGTFEMLVRIVTTRQRVKLASSET